MTKRTALCLVATDEQAHATVAQLTAAGFSQDDISVLFPDKGSTKEFAHQKEAKLPEGAHDISSTGEAHTDAPASGHLEGRGGAVPADPSKN